MPLPLAPIAGIALRYGVVAVATYAITRRVKRGFYDQRGEDAMNDVNEGLSMRRDSDQINGTARYKRIVRLGANGPGVEIDITALGRIKFRRI
ncbi:MAG: hypothetical protein ACU0C9_04960 [Paracoccaceae bacterium]